LGKKGKIGQLINLGAKGESQTWGKEWASGERKKGTSPSESDRLTDIEVKVPPRRGVKEEGKKTIAGASA